MPKIFENCPLSFSSNWQFWPLFWERDRQECSAGCI